VSEIIRVQDEYYILATSPLADTQTRVLKQGETFAIFDLYGDIKGLKKGEQGIYHNGTRHLSQSRLLLGDERPLILGSTVTEDNVVFAVDLTNPDMTLSGQLVQRGGLHLMRSIFLWEGVCYERLRLFNYSEDPLDADLTFEMDADFADIFEVRGVVREARGVLHRGEVTGDELVIRYDGVDGVERRTRVLCSPEGHPTEDGVRFQVTVPSRASREFFVTIVCEGGDRTKTPMSYADAIIKQREGQQELSTSQTEITTSNEVFNQWVNRSLADLRMMITQTEHGPFPYAGVPWFAAPFGRDSIIAAYQMLWIDASLARGVLAYLAATQATEFDHERESEPGKILHERRTGELAALGEVPFGMYYGSVDATPLFVALAGEYLAHTDDIPFMESIWGNIEAALSWIDTYGDADGDGFVEYKGSERGLIQQGWKDSHDSVFHADGSIATPPIALCEVQAYTYWAKCSAARAARALRKPGRATQLEEQAEALKKTFEEKFWLDDLGTYALALDGRKEPCAVRASNAGHCLLAGIADDDRAKIVAETLMSEDFYSGWGIRTLATSEVRYGPITYHNGSIWPHDNSLIAAGLASYGFREDVHRIMAAFLDASAILEFHRLPELYCGFSRRPGQGPIEYPLACAPQAWASGSLFLMLRASLGLSVDASKRQIVLNRPTLPSYLKEVRLNGVRAGAGSADLVLSYHQHDDVGVNVVGRSGGVEVVVYK
jgi:glycogen debranching enzyme